MKISEEKNNKESVMSVNKIPIKEKREMQKSTKIALIVSVSIFCTTIIFLPISILLFSFAGLFLGVFILLPISSAILIIVPTITWIIMRVKLRRDLISNHTTSSSLTNVNPEE
jgi:uncharacterized membrane protein